MQVYSLMSNNKMNLISQRIAFQIANDLKLFIPKHDGTSTEFNTDIIRMAISAGVNITIHAFKQAIKFNVQEELIKKYLRDNVKGYK